MNPQNQFCPNLDCPARGQIGQGNISIPNRKEQRYRCHCCGKTFTESKGTALYGLKEAPERFVQVTTLLAYGVRGKPASPPLAWMNGWCGTG